MYPPEEAETIETGYQKFIKDKSKNVMELNNLHDIEFCNTDRGFAQVKKSAR
jgi:hypothetical protein